MADPYKLSTNDYAEGPMDWLFSLLEPPEWHKRAKCRGMYSDGQTHNPFYAAKGEITGDDYPAKRICMTCPVQAPCLEAGMHDNFGVWGGQSARQRRIKRRARKAMTRLLPPEVGDRLEGVVNG